MFACEYKFTPKKNVAREEFMAELGAFVSELGRGGQTIKEDTLLSELAEIRYVCVCPEADSLNRKHHTPFAQKHYAQLLKLSDQPPEIVVLGKVIEEPGACDCAKRPHLVLFMNFLDHGSPVVCGQCHRPVPLYHLPPPESGHYGGYLDWQDRCRKCNALFVPSDQGEQSGYRQISDWKSELSRLGRKLGAGLEQQTSLPVFYYLPRERGTGVQPPSGQCPSCSQPLIRQVSTLFPLRCDDCRLVTG